jgi:hypothetical protein
MPLPLEIKMLSARNPVKIFFAGKVSNCFDLTGLFGYPLTLTWRQCTA